MIVTNVNKVCDGSLLVVECDQCGLHAKKAGRDPGEASEKARSEGFITIRGATIASPKSWLCLKCSGASVTKDVD